MLILFWYIWGYMYIRDMKYLIKINPKSVRRNPNAFRTETTFPTISRMNLSFYAPANSASMLNGKIVAPMPYPEFVLGENILIEEAECSSDFCSIKCVAIGSKLFELLESGKQFEGVQIEAIQDYETVRHAPDPEFFYSYQKTKVKCEVCENTFNHNKLTSDEDELGHYIQDICPVCFTPNCCNIEYEKFNKLDYERLPTTTQSKRNP